MYEPGQAVSTSGPEGVGEFRPYRGTHEVGLVCPEGLVLPYCGRIDDDAVIDAARQVVAAEYLKRKFVNPEEVVDGVILPSSDPYVGHSEYYVDIKETPSRRRMGMRNRVSDTQDTDEARIAGTVRKIKFVPEKGAGSFPVLDKQHLLDPDAVDEIYRVGLENTVEISALVRDSRVDVDGMSALRLYRRAFQDSWNNGNNEQLYIMACNPRLFENFTMIFNGAFRRIGPDLDYPGQEAIPAMINLREGALSLISSANNPKNPYKNLHRTVVDYFLSGADIDKVDEEILGALNEGGFQDTIAKMRGSGKSIIETYPEPPMKKIKSQARAAVIAEKIKERRPELVWGSAALLALTAVRAYAVDVGVEPYSDVDTGIFLGIEIATTPTLALGYGDIFRSMREPEKYGIIQRARGMGLAVTSFAAPYLYVWAEGGGMPDSSKWGAAGFLALGIASAAQKLRKGRMAASDSRGSKETARHEEPSAG